MSTPKIRAPKKLTFHVHDLDTLIHYLIKRKRITEEDAHTFRRWWWWKLEPLLPDTIRYVPIGYWGWTYPPLLKRRVLPLWWRQSPPKGIEDTPEAQAAYRVLMQLIRFKDKNGDVRVFVGGS